MIRTTAAAVALGFALVGCAAPETSAKPSEPGKFEQTWIASYGETSCAQWINDMDQHETFVAAADMLTSQQQDDGSKDLPEDELIEQFKSDVTSTCQTEGAEGLQIAEIGLLLYRTEKPTYKP